MKNMLRIPALFFLIVSIALNSEVAIAQKITHYDGSVYIDSLKILNATFNVSYQNTHEKDFHFYLNKNANIKQLKFGDQAVGYKVIDTIEDLKNIRIQNTFPSKFILTIIYSYPLDKIESAVFAYNPNWIELSLYTGWFPVNIDDKNYSYYLKFHKPEEYEVIGNGVIKNEKSNVIIANSNNHFDIPVILSKEFQRFSSGNNRMKFYGTKLSKEKINEIRVISQSIYSFFETWYGITDSDNLIIAVNPFGHDMSYARKGFISLSLLDGFGPVDKKVLAHEIGHLWWQNAKVEGWEDWLNESFAEFAALKWIENTLSKDAFQKLLKKYEDAYKKPIRISQITKSDNQWHSVAYFKGPYLLYKLEQNIGEEKMLFFLKAIHKRKVSTTEEMITVLKEYADEISVNAFKAEVY